MTKWSCSTLTALPAHLQTITARFASSNLSFFFFSSRRRHTRFDCDWSSDVCSSDLRTAPAILEDLQSESIEGRRRKLRGYANVGLLCIHEVGYLSYDDKAADILFERSEERRVGKECRSRWSPYH